MEDEWRLEGGWVEDGLRDGWKGRAVVVVVGDGYLAVAEEDGDQTVVVKVYARLWPLQQRRDTGPYTGV